MATFEIPLTPEPQKFTTILSGTTYQFTILWRGMWVLDIANANRVPILSGIPLVDGVDLLEPHKHLGFTGQLWMKSVDGSQLTVHNLGTTVKMVYVE